MALYKCKSRKVSYAAKADELTSVFAPGKAMRVMRTILIFVVACSCAISLGGCKDSDVLTQKIIGAPNEYEVDYNLAPVSYDNPLAKTNASSEYEDEESEREDDREDNTPEYTDNEEEASTDEQIDQQMQSELATADQQASTGVEAAPDAPSATGAPSAPSNTKKPGAGDQFDTPQSNDPGPGYVSLDDLLDRDDDDDIWKSPFDNLMDLLNPDNDDDPFSSNPGGDDTAQSPGDDWQGDTDLEPNNPSGDKPSIVTPDDGYDNLPKTKKVAASGPYALIAQALGGEGTLAVCNSDWYDELPSQAFNGKSELADTARLSSWGDGTVMNEQTFQAIVNSGADTVICSVNYGGVTQDYASRFNEAGISVVQVPAINIANAYDEDIAECVDVIGELLKESGCTVNGRTSREMADEWKWQHDQAIESTVAANGGYAVHSAEGYTFPWIYQGKAFSASACEPVTSTNTFCRSVYIANWKSGELSEKGSLVQRRVGSKIWFWPWGDYCDYSAQMFSVRVSDGEPQTLSGQSGYTSSKYSLVSYYLQCAGVADMGVENTFSGGFLTAKTGSSSGEANSEWNRVYPGCEEYPAVIAGDSSIANLVRHSANIADRTSRSVGLCNFGAPYRIYVMPQGVAGNWGDGTFESFLMSPWAYCMFQCSDGDGDIDMSAVNERAAEFYSAFYRCQNGGSGILDTQNSYWGGYLQAECPRD